MVDDPFFVILGLHSSGSSALAGVCHHLGLYLGEQLGGYYGRDPNESCGFEDAELDEICNRFARLGDTARRHHPRLVHRRLADWVRRTHVQAKSLGTFGGGKYPQLCLCGRELKAFLGERLRIIAADRPLDESIRSIQRRCRGRPDDQVLASHQQWLWDEKEALIATLPADSVLRVEFDELLESPNETVGRVGTFLGIASAQEAFERAVNFVDPAQRHVKL